MLLLLISVGCSAHSDETQTQTDTESLSVEESESASETEAEATETESGTETDTAAEPNPPAEFDDREGTVTVITNALKIRSAPDMEQSEVIGYAVDGDSFPMTGGNGDWCRILYNRETAYVTASPKYVLITYADSSTETETATETATETEPESESATETETEPESETGTWGQTEYAPDRWENTVVDTSKTEYTFEEMEEDLRILASRYPSYFTYRSIGTSLDGRSIYCATLGNPNASRQIVVTAGIHAREYISCLLVMAQAEFYLDNYAVGSRNGETFSELFSACAVVIVPMVNPDGVTLAQKGIASVRNEEVKKLLLAAYESDKKYGLTASSSSMDGYFRTWKANLAGVDLNRNFATPDWESYRKMLKPSMQNFKGTTPESEPETQALTALMADLSNPVASLCIHSQGEVVYWNCGQTGELLESSRALARIAVTLTGYRYITEENHDASFSDYCVMNLDVPAITVEIGNGNGSSLVPASQIPKILTDNRFLWAATISYFLN